MLIFKMKKFFLPLIFLAWVLMSSFHPSDKTFLKLFEKKEYPKIKESFEKRIEEYPNDPLAYFWKSKYYFEKSNPKNNPEQANDAIILCRNLYSKVKDEKIKQKMLDSPIQMPEIEELHQKINAEAFAKVKKVNTEIAFENFLKKYEKHTFEAEAVKLMQEAAFLEVTKKNTWQEFQSFLKKYPSAPQTAEAKKQYEILLFKDKTKDKKLTSFVQFLKENPQSPFRNEIEDNIYKLSVKMPDFQTLKNFIKTYPDNPNVAKAWNWLYYLHTDKEILLKNFPDFPDKARAKAAQSVKSMRFFPFCEKGKIGFMDESGNERVKPIADSIPEDFKCEFWQDEYMPIISKTGKYGLADKLGNVLFEPIYDAVEDLSSPTVRILKGKHYAIFCKNGEQLSDFIYDDVLSVGDFNLVAKTNKKWKFLTANGNETDLPTFDDAEVLNGIVCKVSSGGKTQLITADELYEFATGKKKFVSKTISVDDLTPVNKYFYVLTSGSKIGLLSAQGKLILEPVGDDFNFNEELTVVRQGEKQLFYDAQCKLIAEAKFAKVFFEGKNTFVQKDGKFGLFDPKADNYCNCLWDTLALREHGFWYSEAGQKKFIAENGTAYNLSEYTDFLTKKIDDKLFLIVSNKAGKKNILSQDGKLLSKTWYDDIEPMSEGYFRFKKLKKFGLIDAAGKIIIQPIYTGLVEVKKGYFSVLINKKFGLFVPAKKLEIKPLYDVTVQPYPQSDDLYVAKKGKFGIINAQSRSIVPFTFDRILFWTEDKMMVQLEKKWKIVDILAPTEETESFEDYSQLKTAPDEIMFITYNPTGFGLLSNKKGRLMTDEYSQIINLGTYEEPFYFAERYMSQANLYIILYFDKNGKVVRKQSLTEEEYAKIGCAEN